MDMHQEICCVIYSQRKNIYIVPGRSETIKGQTLCFGSQDVAGVLLTGRIPLLPYSFVAGQVTYLQLVFYTSVFPLTLHFVSIFHNIFSLLVPLTSFQCLYLLFCL